MDIDMEQGPADNVANSPYMQGTSYVVQYAEDQWNRYDKAGQDICFHRWARRATPLGATEIVLRLLPDPLFPSTEHTGPYIARREPIAPDPAKDMRVSVLVTVEIDPHRWGAASELEKTELRQKARGFVSVGARFKLRVGDRVIEEGRR